MDPSKALNVVRSAESDGGIRGARGEVKLCQPLHLDVYGVTGK